MSSGAGTRVLVVGGGIVGLTIAFRALEAGFEVVCLDAAYPGVSSAVALGYVSAPSILDVPADIVEFGAAAYREFETFRNDLSSYVGSTFSAANLGYLHVTTHARGNDLALLADSWSSVGLDCHVLSGDEARRLEPLLGPEVAGAVQLVDAMQVDPTQIVTDLRSAIDVLGGQVDSGVAVTALTFEGSRCTGVNTGSGPLGADAVVLATGSWTSRVLQTGMAPSIVPVKGQVVILESPTGTVPAQPISTSYELDLMPRASGRLHIGTSNEQVGFHASPTAGVVADLISRAAEIVPSVREYNFVGALAGLRPCTSDRRPILGPHPAWSNVVLATGHCQDGVLMSPISARIIVEVLGGGSVLMSQYQQLGIRPPGDQEA